MPGLTPLPITPPPGVIKTESKRVVEGRWIDCDGIRFVRGRPQKEGGNLRTTITPTSGTPRTIHAWRDNSFNNYMAAGTYRKLYVYDSIWAQNDITPFRTTGTLANNPFTTTSGSVVVSVLHVGHGLAPGDTAVFAGSAAVGGITPNGTFVVTSVTDASNYKFAFTSNASSSTTGGGAAVTYSYEIPVGTELGAYGYGWGIGGWGLGTWGTARPTSTIFIEPRIWSLDHFGKLLMASYNGGSIYLFDPTASQPWGRATLISVDAALPTDCRAMFVTPERYIFALRANMVVSWCTQGDYTIWTPAISNSANSRTLTEGTKLIGGKVLSPFVSLVWTDAALYRFQWTGSTFVYDSSLVGKNCGLVSPNAAISVGGVAYWMGPDQFWMYAGSVTPMPNVEDIRRYVYDDFPIGTVFQTHAVYNPIFNEIRFSYTVMGGTNPTKQVTFHLDDKVWSIGSNWTRTSGDHFSQGDTRPYYGDADGYIYQHEVGYNNNGASQTFTLTMSPIAMQEGMYSMDLQGILWDFFQQSGDITITVTAYDRLTDAAVMDSETDVIPDADAGLTDMRVSGRYLGFTLTGGDIDSYFRFGKPAAFLMPSGKRS